jgi:hypothetical protein
MRKIEGERYLKLRKEGANKSYTQKQIEKRRKGWEGGKEGNL